MTPLKEDVIIFDRKQQCGLVWFGLVMTSSSVSLVQGWLVDLINKFGTLNGFQILHDRFVSGKALNVQIIAALIKYVHAC